MNNTKILLHKLGLLKYKKPIYKKSAVQGIVVATAIGGIVGGLLAIKKK